MSIRLDPLAKVKVYRIFAVLEGSFLINDLLVIILLTRSQKKLITLLALAE
jgi:hypothetical protein